ncbi:hypothetical protein [Sphingobium sp.]|uniref:hypothetical protein n=1 Tax=Sphingobium sp. TaxID=1912891 RepID=UPI00260EBEEE|nr:hypothetical protein [Sphingobium sp.]
MSGELRMLGLAHGLLLGLLLASPLIGPDMLPWAVQALFLLGGFQLRLADRRWDLRGGPIAWISHIRMAPRRLLPWAAAAVVALIAGRIDLAQAIVGATLLCELLVYPISAHLIARLARPMVAGLILLLIGVQGATGSPMLGYVVAFLTGLSTCLFWLRGPDGDGPTMIWALGATTAAIVAPIVAPITLPCAFAVGTVSATLALAHLSVLRRRPVPWRSDLRQTVRRGLWLAPARPF